MTAISTLEQLIGSAAAVLNGEIQIQEISLSENFICTIQIKGEEYEGYVDYGIASFIVELQRSIHKAIRTSKSDLSLQERRDLIHRIKVKAQIRKNCSIVDLILDKTFDAAFSVMTNNQIFIIILAAMGVYFGNKVIQTIAEVKSKAKDEETKQKLMEYAVDALEQAKIINTPMAKLAGRLSKDDTIKFENVDRPLTKQEAKELYSEVEEPVSETIYVDDEYEITGASLEKRYALLKKGSVTILASTQLLNPDSRKYLFETFKEAAIQEKTFQMSLQVTMSIEGFNKSYYVTAIGEKREGSVTLAEIALRFKDTMFDDAPRQASLLDHT
jgi:hypothetical protein